MRICCAKLRNTQISDAGFVFHLQECLMTHKFRRNDIVRPNKDGYFYGRVVRRIDDTHVQVIDCGSMITDYADTDLIAEDYKGYWRDGRTVFVRMPTLRRLKQMAAYYRDDVWRKPKPARCMSWHDDDKVFAPFSDKQIVRLREFQQDGPYAPITCPNIHGDDDTPNKFDNEHYQYQEKHGDRRAGLLVVQKDRLFCPVCDYSQTDAYRYMLRLNWTPKW